MSPSRIKPVEQDDSRSAQPTQNAASFDIRALAQARMARQGTLKREREPSISPPPSRKAPRLKETQVSLPSGARLNMFSSIIEEDQRSRKSAAANAATANLKAETQRAHVKAEPEMEIKSEPGHDDESFNPETLPAGAIKYPNGVVKKTWAFGHARDAHDIKLEEVLEATSLRTAVISAFQWDTDWLLAKLKVPTNGGSTKCVFIMQAKEQDLKDKMLRESEHMRPWLRLCFPPMEGQVNCMHSKLMLLFHADKLRVAIPTANLLDFDWGETGMMENSVFIIDLPRLHNGARITADELTFFGQELLHFCRKQGLDQDVLDGLLNFDFSATANMAFVHTVGGRNHGEDAERTGLPGLARAVRHLNLTTDHGTQVDFAASSIGSLNETFLRTVHAAVRGGDMIARAANTVSTAKATFFMPSASKSRTDQERIGDKMRIYFPTHETVVASTAGAAGTICFSRKWWEAATFPKHCFRDYVSSRNGLLSHNKILYARGKQQDHDSGGEKDIAWVYVGSANMSESAWGKIFHDKKIKAWTLAARNWECGVLLPVPRESLDAGRPCSTKPKVAMKQEKKDDSETESEAEEESAQGSAAAREMVGMEVFDGIVKPPWRIPGDEYSGRQPWFFQERH